MQHNYRLIFKNTFWLYLREGITLFLSLYTSRLLLDQLGVDDYGLYGLIGSVLLMFNALRGLFASAIQRYINVAKATEDKAMIQQIFGLGVFIHIAIACIFIVGVEIAGGILIPTLNIPHESINTAYWILHLSNLTIAVTILTVPYDALIIANEKFDVFAIFALIETLLKLGVVLLLAYSPIPKVIFYSFLLLLVSVLVRGLNAYYCRRHFVDEVNFKIVKNKALFTSITTFAGWQLLGNIGFSIVHAGVNFVINNFGGVAVNAARAIAYQVQSAVSRFVSSVSMSFQPQSIMLYSQGDRELFSKMMLWNAKISFSITAVLSCTMIMMAPILLNFWLSDVPEHTTEMMQAILVYMIIRSLHAPIDTLFKAAGRLKFYQICETAIALLNLPMAWWLLSHDYPYYSVFISMTAIELFSIIVVLIVAKIQLAYESEVYIKTILLRAVLFILIGFCAFIYFYPICPIGTTIEVALLRCVGVPLLTGVLLLIIVFTKQELNELMKIVIRRMK